MARTTVFCESWQEACSGADWSSGWPGKSNVNNWTMDTNGRFDSSSADLAVNTEWTPPDWTSGQQTIVVGFALRPAASSVGKLCVIYDSDGAAEQVYVRLNADRSIEAFNGDNTSLGSTSAGVVADASYSFISLLFHIDNSNGKVLMKVNNSLELDLTSQDTQNTANAYGTSMRLSNRGDFDDVFVGHATTSDASEMYDDTRLIVLKPNSDGTNTDFTPSTGADNYAVVDEEEYNDSDYNDGNNVNDHDEFGHETFSGSGAISFVSHVIRIDKTDAGSRSVEFTCRSGGTVYSAGEFNPTGSFLWYEHFWLTDPDTGVAWTASGLNSAEFGYRITV